VFNFLFGLNGYRYIVIVNVLPIVWYDWTMVFLIEKCSVMAIRMALTFHIFSFYFITTASPISRLARNVPLGVLKKCCYFSKCFDIQDGHPGLWWSWHFWYGRCVPLEFLKKCCYSRNPRWPSWSLVGQDIFYFVSRTTASRLCGNIPPWILK